MKRIAVLGLAVVFAAPAAMASSIEFRVESGGSNLVEVEPGEVVNYEVIGRLTDTANGGLALVGFDLQYSGGDLGPADTPTEDPMASFVRDLGLTNPAGYGGTVIDGDLVQVCGAQNTIVNVASNAPFPIGAVIPDVAQTDQVLVTGSLTAPMDPGDYVLTLANAFANVIQEGEDGNPFWATEAAGIGSISNLTIRIPDDCLVAIIGSDPWDGAIDARQTAEIADDCVTPAGWDSIDLIFGGSAACVEASDILITVAPADVTPPGVANMTVNGTTLTVELDGIIPAGHWTTFTHTPTGSMTRIGYLPADVTGDGTSSPLDILALIDFLNGVGAPLEEWATDINRSNEANSADILREIDLLNGAGCYEPWNGVSLP